MEGEVVLIVPVEVVRQRSRQLEGHVVADVVVGHIPPARRLIQFLIVDGIIVGVVDIQHLLVEARLLGNVGILKHRRREGVCEVVSFAILHDQRVASGILGNRNLHSARLRVVGDIVLDRLTVHYGNALGDGLLDDIGEHLGGIRTEICQLIADGVELLGLALLHACDRSDQVIRCHRILVQLEAEHRIAQRSVSFLARAEQCHSLGLGVGVGKRLARVVVTVAVGIGRARRGNNAQRAGGFIRRYNYL